MRPRGQEDLERRREAQGETKCGPGTQCLMSRPLGGGQQGRSPRTESASSSPSPASAPHNHHPNSKTEL